MRADDVPAMLWTGNPDNLPYYRSHGFDVIHEFRIPRDTPNWFMERPATEACETQRGPVETHLGVRNQPEMRQSDARGMTTPDLSGSRVLVVDDDPIVRDVLLPLPRPRRASRPRRRADGLSALAAFEARRPTWWCST